MESAINNMVIIRYYRDRRPWDSVKIKNPAWQEVENAIRQMDNYCFPIVQLNTTESDENEDIFNIIGENSRYALFQLFGKWQYCDPNGEKTPARLWDSDQGYFCEERNVIQDIDLVLRIAKSYYETGSYEVLRF